jgi:hypothetical protein
MFHRTIFSSLLVVSLLGLAAPACDGGDDACDGNGDDGNGDDGNADDGNADDGNADDGNGDDGNADDGNADDGNADDGNADDGNADDGNADDGGGGGVGDQCQTDADCSSNACIFAGDVDFGICTILCEDFSDCPSFWSCEEIGNATGTYCVPD